jgi:hypothetical protein
MEQHGHPSTAAHATPDVACYDSAMEEPIRKQLLPGAIVEVTQQIPHRDRVWTNRITGTIIAYEQKQTGSWFAHSKDDKLWLDRLILRKEDGEITSLNLDDYTHLEVLSPAPAAKLPA